MPSDSGIGGGQPTATTRSQLVASSPQVSTDRLRIHAEALSDRCERLPNLVSPGGLQNLLLAKVRRQGLPLHAMPVEVVLHRATSNAEALGDYEDRFARSVPTNDLGCSLLPYDGDAFYQVAVVRIRPRAYNRACCPLEETVELIW